jgi:hypothetical protein
MGATYPLAGAVKTYAKSRIANATQKTGVMAKRTIKDAPVFAYNKAKNHFNEKREQKRQISYTGGLMPKNKITKPNKKEEHAKRKT